MAGIIPGLKPGKGTIIKSITCRIMQVDSHCIAIQILFITFDRTFYLKRQEA
jgi:hypothetical protein